MSIKTETILNQLIDIDTQLFLFLNGLNTPFFDIVFYLITNRFFWIPLYIYLLYLIFKKNHKTTLKIGIFIGLLFLIADQTSVLLFKEVFERLRPCHNPELKDVVHTLYGKCGGQFGFISSHAANSFALAIFAGNMLKKYYKNILKWLLLWALVVSYSRIYAGVHYPADILVGILLGSIVGVSVFQFMKYSDQKFNLNIDTFR